MIAEKTKVITLEKQNKRLNALGIAIVYSILINIGLHYAIPFILKQYASSFTIFNSVTVTTVFEIFTFFISFFIPFFIVKLTSGIKFKEIFGAPKLGILQYLRYISLGYAIYLLLYFFTNIILINVYRQPVIMTLHPALDLSTINVMTLYIVYFVLILPLIEEFVYRGVMLQCIKVYGAKFAILLSAFLYMLFNQGGPYFLVYFVLGLYYSYITLFHKSIYPSIITRMGINILILIFFYVPMAYTWILGLLTVVMYVVAIFTLISILVHNVDLIQPILLRDSLYLFKTSKVMIFAIILLILSSFYYLIV